MNPKFKILELECELIKNIIQGNEPHSSKINKVDDYSYDLGLATKENDLTDFISEGFIIKRISDSKINITIEDKYTKPILSEFNINNKPEFIAKKLTYPWNLLVIMYESNTFVQDDQFLVSKLKEVLIRS